MTERQPVTEHQPVTARPPVTAVTDLREATQVFTDPDSYADERRFHAACALLRREVPVARVEHPGFDPFWAITKHADLLEVERQHRVWVSAPRTALSPRSQRESGSPPFRSLVQMDAPDHPLYRGITAEWFRPNSIGRLSPRITELAKRAVDHMAELGNSCDFVTDVAIEYPLQVILALLGIPEADYPLMLRLTQELFGTVDPEMARDGVPQDPLRTMAAFFEYFRDLTEDRRARPRDDLASVIANARVDGKVLSMADAVGYYVIIATAGHDTTSSTVAGGLHALLENPDQLQHLRQDPSLVTDAAEEMIRWVSPVKQFMRTATERCTLRGVDFVPGDAVLLSYPSANRDEEVFEHPERFEIDRRPNRHVGFGFGVHHCLGAQLARLEVRALYAELVPRLAEMALAGEPSYVRTLFVGGPKHLPISYRLR